MFWEQLYLLQVPFPIGMTFLKAQGMEMAWRRSFWTYDNIKLIDVVADLRKKKNLPPTELNNRVIGCINIFAKILKTDKIYNAINTKSKAG